MSNQHDALFRQKLRELFPLLPMDGARLDVPQRLWWEFDRDQKRAYALVDEAIAFHRKRDRVLDATYPKERYSLSCRLLQLWRKTPAAAMVELDRLERALMPSIPRTQFAREFAPMTPRQVKQHASLRNSKRNLR